MTWLINRYMPQLTDTAEKNKGGSFVYAFGSNKAFHLVAITLTQRN